MRFRFSLFLSVALAAMVIVTGCSQAAPSTKPGTEAEKPAASSAPAKLRTTVLSIANYTPMLVARDKGFFKEENLDVSWTTVAQGQVAIEAVYGGSAEIGGSAVFEPLVARASGLDIVFVAAQTSMSAQAPQNAAMLVRSDGSIKSPKDLAGKTVSAGLINSVNYIHTVVWLRKYGVDPKTVKFVELPFPQMNDALFQKRVDAVFNVEPFIAAATKSGQATVLGYPYLENIPGMDIAHYVAKESWVKANADVAARFKRAIDKGTNYLNSVSAEERNDWVAKYTGLKPEIVAETHNPIFTTEYNVPSIQKNLELAVEFGVVKQPFDVSTMIWKP